MNPDYGYSFEERSVSKSELALEIAKERGLPIVEINVPNPRSYRKQTAATSFKEKIHNVRDNRDVLSVMSEVILAFNQLATDCDYDQSVLKDCRAFIEDKFTVKFNF